jgi:hypothetical protein
MGFFSIDNYCLKNNPLPAFGRYWGIIVLSLFAVFPTVRSSRAYAEPAKEPGISFSVPYDCTERELIKRKGVKTFCLADAFKAGLNVVLVGRERYCKAKTAGTFTDDLSVSHQDSPVKATRLAWTRRCSIREDAKDFDLAVVGVDPDAVEVIEPQTCHPLDLETKARLVAKSPPDPCDSPGHQRCFQEYVADSPPAVFRLGDATLFIFKYTEENFGDDGPLILAVRDKVFRLSGTCIYSRPFFFTVNNKIHLAYWATVGCCGCGDSWFFVYDLSGESPQLVYENGDFAD